MKILMPFLFLFPIRLFCQSVQVYDQYADLVTRLNQGGDSLFILNFWATWCKPCVGELPYFEEMTQKIGDRKEKVILVSIDFKKDLEKRLIPFVQGKSLKSEVALLADSDTNSWIEKVDKTWDGAIPVTYLYKNGRKVFHKDKFKDFGALESFVKSF